MIPMPICYCGDWWMLRDCPTCAWSAILAHPPVAGSRVEVAETGSSPWTGTVIGPKGLDGLLVVVALDVPGIDEDGDPETERVVQIAACRVLPRERGEG